MRNLICLLCLAALSASAETYDAWSHDAAVATGRVSVLYRPWPGFAAVKTPFENIHGSYEGDLLLQADSSAVLHEPLLVRIRYAGVKSDEVEGVHVRPGTQIRETLAASETTLPVLAAHAGRLCFGFPGARCRRAIQQHELSVLVARYEVVDGAGSVLARGIVPQFACTGNGPNASDAWVMGDAEADRRLREQCGLNAVETVTALPEAAAAYEGVRAIWVSRAAWDATTGDPHFWQRRLLQGVSLYGRPETVQAMQATLDPASNGVLLAAQLAAPPAAVVQGSLKQFRQSYGQPGSLDLTYTNNGCLELSALENILPLFPDAVHYRVWTLGVLGLFAFGTVVLLALTCLRLPGPRRMALWWGLPAWAVLFALLGGGAGRLVLSRQARADVTEYRYAHLQWPEMYCQAVGRMLRFDGRECAWQLPAHAMDCPGAPELTSGEMSRLVVRHAHFTPDEVQMASFGVAPGSSDSTGASWFRARQLPFEVVAADKGRRLHATANLSDVYVWAANRWHKLGAMASGQEADPLAASVPLLDRVPGLPLAIAGSWSKGANLNGLVDHCDETGEMPGPYPAAGSTWLIVAQQACEPGMRPLDAGVKLSGRVVWIVQCP